MDIVATDTCEGQARYGNCKSPLCCAEVAPLCRAPPARLPALRESFPERKPAAAAKELPFFMCKLTASAGQK